MAEFGLPESKRWGENCLGMTVKDFAAAMRTGVYEGGCPYFNENNVRGYQGSVAVGTEHYIYKVSRTDTEVLPETVATAITANSAKIQRCVDDGRKFDATVWQGGRCYMLWHRRQELGTASVPPRPI